VADTSIEKLNALLADLDQVIAEYQVADYDHHNLDFHRQITHLCDSDILIAEIERSYRLPFAGPSAFPTSKDDSRRFRASLTIGQEHHYQMVSALSRREGSRGFSLMTEHARLAHENVRAAIRSREQAPQLALVNNAL